MEPCRGHLPWGASCVAGRTLSGRASPTPAPPPPCRVVACPEPVGGWAQAPVTWGLVGWPEQASPRPEQRHGRPCVFILLSTNGIFSNGDWEMDLVFKKDVDFDDKAQGKYIP